MPNTNDFFDQTNNMDDQSQETTPTFKIGEEEFSQDELQRLVGLGKIGSELEEKWNTKLDRVYPEYTKSRQETEELKKTLASKETEELRIKAQQGNLTPDEQRKQAHALFTEMGFVTKEEAASVADERSRANYEAYKLIDRIDNFVAQQEAEGNPKSTTTAIIEHMNKEGFKNPEKAYKDLYEKELDEIKTKKLQSLKQPGLYTESTSTAGAKQPEQIRPTKDNLETLVQAALQGGR